MNTFGPYKTNGLILSSLSPILHARPVTDQYISLWDPVCRLMIGFFLIYLYIFFNQDIGVKYLPALPMTNLYRGI